MTTYRITDPRERTCKERGWRYEMHDAVRGVVGKEFDDYHEAHKALKAAGFEKDPYNYGESWMTYERAGYLTDIAVYVKVERVE